LRDKTLLFLKEKKQQKDLFKGLLCNVRWLADMFYRYLMVEKTNFILVSHACISSSSPGKAGLTTLLCKGPWQSTAFLPQTKKRWHPELPGLPTLFVCL